METSSDVLNRLRDRLSEIQARRPEYSLRAYSRDLGIPAPVLSQLMRGKRRLTLELTKKLCSALAISAHESTEIIKNYPVKGGVSLLFTQLGQDEFHAVSDWYCFAVLALLETTDCIGEAKWISNKLRISMAQTKSSLDTMLRLGLVKQTDGKYLPSGRQFTTTQDLPSDAIKKNHSQGLDLARGALFEVPVELREFGSNTLSVAEEDLDDLKKELRKLRRRFVKRATSKLKRNLVYRLQLQFFPLTKGK